MIRLFIWALLIYIGYRVIKSFASGKKVATPSTVKHAEAAATHLDPVCGIYVSEDDAVIGRLDGQRHFFCSHACLEKFRQKLDHLQT